MAMAYAGYSSEMALWKQEEVETLKNIMRLHVKNVRIDGVRQTSNES